ncbi:MAG: DUF3576 domain-containing protein [Hyphomonadaceae bacterium]
MKQRAALSAAILIAAAGALSACGHDPNRATGQSRLSDGGDGGLGLPFFGGHRQASSSSTPQIGVNSLLWRASLDTLAFMPLASEDPFGGVIITDWYSDPNHPSERFKATVYILDTRLRADAVNVSIFRQTQTAGGWADSAVDPDTAIQIENAILTRARQLRLSSVSQ